jgi:hypothetical protein
MTTLCFDGRYLAADTLSHRSNTPSNMLQPKITIEGGFAYAVGGMWCAMVPQLIKWHQEGAEPDGLPKAENGMLLIVELSTRRLWCVVPAVPYLDEEGAPFTVGSGGDIALGAIDAGKTAMEAVRIAAKRDLHTNDIIDFVDLEWADKGVQRWDGLMPSSKAPVRDTSGTPIREYVHADTDEEGNPRLVAHEALHLAQSERAVGICTHGYVRRTCDVCRREVAAAVAEVRHAKANGHA